MITAGAALAVGLVAGNVRAVVVSVVSSFGALALLATGIVRSPGSGPP